MPIGTAIAFASGKGGVGKSTISAGVAEALARKGYRTLAVDADLFNRSLDLYIGADSGGVYDLGDVLENRCTLEDAICKSDFCGNLWYLPATIGHDNIEPIIPYFEIILNKLKCNFDYIIFDIAAGLGKAFKFFTRFADITCVVTTLQRSSIRDAERASELLLNKKAYIVVNMVNPADIVNNLAPNIDDIMDMTGLPLIGILPVEGRLQAWQNKGSSAFELKNSAIVTEFNDIAHRLCGERRLQNKFW